MRFSSPRENFFLRVLSRVVSEGTFSLLFVSNKQFYHKVFGGKANIATAFNVTAQFTKHKIFHLGKHSADE